MSLKTLPIKTYAIMQVYKLKTTAYDEDDFFIMADISEEDIIAVVKPLLPKEWEDRDSPDAEAIALALRRAYNTKNVKVLDGLTEILF